MIIIRRIRFGVFQLRKRGGDKCFLCLPSCDTPNVLYLTLGKAAHLPKCSYAQPFLASIYNDKIFIISFLLKAIIFW